MKTENLNQACASIDVFCDDLRAAHGDAIQSGNSFAEIVLLSLLEDAAKLQTKLNRAKDAEMQTAPTKG